MSKELHYNNPIVLQRADPYVYRHTDGYYYFTGSVPAYDCIELRRAKTIAELADAETFVVWRKHESGEMSQQASTRSSYRTTSQVLKKVFSVACISRLTSHRINW